MTAYISTNVMTVKELLFLQSTKFYGISVPVHRKAVNKDNRQSPRNNVK